MPTSTPGFPAAFIPAGSKRRAPSNLVQDAAEGKKARDHMENEAQRVAAFNGAVLAHATTYGITAPQEPATAANQEAFPSQRQHFTIPNPLADRQHGTSALESALHAFVARVVKFAASAAGRQLHCQFFVHTQDSDEWVLQEGTVGDLVDADYNGLRDKVDQDLLNKHVLRGIKDHARGKSIEFGGVSLVRFAVPVLDVYASLDNAAQALGVTSVDTLAGQLVVDWSLQHAMIESTPEDAAAKPVEVSAAEPLVSPSSPWELTADQLQLQLPPRTPSPRPASPPTPSPRSCTHTSNDVLYDPEMTGIKLQLDHTKCLACMRDLAVRLAPAATTTFNNRRITTLVRDAAGDEKKPYRTALRHMRKHSHLMSDAWIQAAEFAGYVLDAPAPTSPVFLARVADLANVRVTEDVKEFGDLSDDQVRVALVGHVFKDVVLGVFEEHGMLEAYEGGVTRQTVDAACDLVMEQEFVESLGKEAARLTPWELVLRALGDVWTGEYLRMERGFDSLTTKEDWKEGEEEDGLGDAKAEGSGANGKI